MNKTPIELSEDDLEAGISLVEVVVAMTIFAVFMLSTGATLMGGIAQRRHAYDTYEALTIARDFLSEVQEVANLPQDLTADEGIGSVYQVYQGATFPAPALPGGSITVQIHASEASVPTELGGPQDLNFDADDDDDLDSTAAGSDLRIVPMTITLTWGSGTEQTTLIMHRLVTNTTN